MIEVLEPGAHTTVQDAGRFGQLRFGIPPSGPLDRFAFVAANRLLGNCDAATLECTLMGPTLRFHGACAVAVTGADMPVRINGVAAERWQTVLVRAGDTMKLGTARSGLRTYLAVSGGLDVAQVLGSCATYVRGSLGGVEGRALRKGDRIRLLAAPLPPPQRVAAWAIPRYPSEIEVRAVLGPQSDRFMRAGIETFLGNIYTVLPQSDRMGARLSGPRIEHANGHDIVSDGIALGAVQVPGDGQPIVLLVDRQSTGGYTKIATVCSFDIGAIGQLRPGQRLRFREVSVDQAHVFALEWRRRCDSLPIEEVA